MFTSKKPYSKELATHSKSPIATKADIELVASKAIGTPGPVGPQGPKGDTGEVTQAEFDDLVARVEALENA